MIHIDLNTNTNPPVWLALILDESGSMSNVAEETAAGVRNYMADRRKEKGAENYKFWFTKFSTSVRTVLAGATVNALDTIPYNPKGNTALFDAVVMTVENIALLEKQSLEKPRILVTIVTDGEDNVSQTTMAQCAKLIQQKETEGWTFAFMGADQDSWKAAQKMNIRMSNVANYHKGQTTNSFRRLSSQTAEYTADCMSTTLFAGATDRDGFVITNPTDAV